MQKIQTFLWFDNQAEDAASFYASIFKNSKILSRMPGPGGRSMGATLEVDRRQFIAFNGGPQYHPTQAISFTVYCETEPEIDGLWGKLSNGGKVMMALNRYPWSDKYGWVEDRFGVSWQLTLSDCRQPITPSMLFAGKQQGRAEEAMQFYGSQFENSSIAFTARYQAGEPGPEGQVKFGSFSLDGQGFIAMDSGVPMDVAFTPGISMFVNCETQQQVDRLWDGLAEGGRHDRCGWLQDKFGVSWQVVPTALARLLSDKDSAKSQRVMQAMLKMTKLDIAGLQQAGDRA